MRHSHGKSRRGRRYVCHKKEIEYHLNAAERRYLARQGSRDAFHRGAIQPFVTTKQEPVCRLRHSHGHTRRGAALCLSLKEIEYHLNAAERRYLARQDDKALEMLFHLGAMKSFGTDKAGNQSVGCVTLPFAPRSGAKSVTKKRLSTISMPRSGVASRDKTTRL